MEFLSEPNKEPAKFFVYNQRNSNATFTIDSTRGIGRDVAIEAFNADHANQRAVEIGLYFTPNGSVEYDCPCRYCGKRWYQATESDAETFDEMFYEYGKLYRPNDIVYIHRLDGIIESVDCSTLPTLKG